MKMTIPHIMFSDSTELEAGASYTGGQEQVIAAKG